MSLHTTVRLLAAFQHLAAQSDVFNLLRASHSLTQPKPMGQRSQGGQLEAECPIPRNLKSGLVEVFEHPGLVLLIEKQL